MKIACAKCGVVFQRPKSSPGPYCSVECRFWARLIPSKPDDCWPWTGGQRDGYGTFRFLGRSDYAHRVAYFFIRGIKPKGVLRHTCDYPPCCNPNHLIDGTQAENNRDRHQKGRTKMPYGMSEGAKKLTEDDVRKIRADRRYRAGAIMAREFGISTHLVSRIRKRKAWAHVT